jgi:hypothetical protein
VPFAVALQRRELIVKNLLGLVEQPPDQRGLAVIDAAAGDEAQQLLALLLGEPRLDVGRAVQK